MLNPPDLAITTCETAEHLDAAGPVLPERKSLATLSGPHKLWYALLELTVREIMVPRVDIVALSADLPAGGRAQMALHVRPEPDGTWRVTWLAAPAGSWPVPERPAL